MATSPEDKALLNDLSDRFNTFLSRTKEPSELTGAQRKLLEDSLHPLINGYRAWKGTSNNDYSNWQVGDSIINIDNTNKVQILGMVISTPFNPTTDIDNKSKFDKYQNNKPSF